MSPRVLLPLATGFEELEAVTIVDVLRRAGLDLKTAGLGGLEITGAHGITLRADLSLAAAARERWDLIVLPGGLPGATNLRDDPTLRALLAAQHARGGRLAAICAAPIALAAAGALSGRRATCYPSFEEQLTGAQIAGGAVVVDGPLTTSRGPGTALEFALTLVAQLAGRAKADELRRGLLVAGAAG